MDGLDHDLSTEEIAERRRVVSASGVFAPVAALNPEAGRHAIPSDPREVQAALRAGEHSWRRFPYFAWRYGERGRRFTRSDSAWLVTLAEHEQELVDRQVLWLGALLAARGMPRWLLQAHLEALHEELARTVPERAPAYARLLQAAGMLHTLRRRRVSDETFEALAAAFDRRVGAAWASCLPEGGRLVVAAVADERDGIERALASVQDWLADPARFPAAWIDAVRWISHEARARAAG